MQRLLIIGPAPQNIGGISIHIRRLVALLKDEYELDFVDEWHTRQEGIFNLRSGNIIKYLAKVIKADIIHVQSGIWSLRAFHIIVCRLLFRKKVIVTIHRDPNIEPHTSLTKRLLSKCNCAILVNKEGYNAMKTKGKCRYYLLPAFLPPVMDEEPSVPEEVMRWIVKVKENKDSFLMCSNAWKLVLHNGQDLYGIDTCIEALHILKECGEENNYLVFVVASNPDEKERILHYKDLINKYGITEHVLLWENPASFVRIIQLSDLVLRTTNTDGDAISIREAQFLGKPVLASDVVGRPEGVQLFKTRDANDLADKIVCARGNKEKVALSKQIDYRALFRSIYE